VLNILFAYFEKFRLLSQADLGNEKTSDVTATWYPSVPTTLAAMAGVGLQKGPPERVAPNGSKADRGNNTRMAKLQVAEVHRVDFIVPLRKLAGG
jgi:hypothetical protein